MLWIKYWINKARKYSNNIQPKISKHSLRIRDRNLICKLRSNPSIKEQNYSLWNYKLPILGSWEIYYEIN